MKRFVVSILAVAVFFVGLGTLAEQVGARFKSDEKALEVIRKARTAIGGDAAIAQVRSMIISGRTTHNFKFDGAERSEQGETEIAFQFPDKMVTSVKMGKDDGTGARIVQQQHDVIITHKGGTGEFRMVHPENGEIRAADGKKIIVREVLPPDAPVTTGDGNKVIVRKSDGGERGTFKVRTNGENGPEEVRDIVIARGEHARAHAPVKRNELLRVALSLLLTAPEGMNVNYTFAGETDVDGTAVNVINAEFGGVNYKLYIGKANNLPVAMSYTATTFPMMINFTKVLPADAPAPDAGRDTVAFTKKLHADAAPVENFVRFSDYRSVGGVQLPYRWTTSVAGSVKETFDVTTFDVNPANIAEKFQNQKVMVRTKKADGQ